MGQGRIASTRLRSVPGPKVMTQGTIRMAPSLHMLAPGRLNAGEVFLNLGSRLSHCRHAVVFC
jgi:hypothetical protein